MAPRNNQRSTPARSSSPARSSAPARSNPAPSRGASQAAVQAFIASNPGSRTAQAAAAPKPTTVNQGLKIAGTGGITKRELQNISNTTGRSGAQVIQRLDALNQKLKGKDQVGISLNSGAANMLIRQAQKQPTGMFGMSSQFGTGQIGKALQGMLGTPGYTAPRNPQSGAPYGGSRRRTPGTGLMMGGTAIRPGGRPTVRGFGKQFAGMPTSGEVETTPVVEEPTTATDLPVDDFAMPTMEEEKLEEEEKPQFMPGSAADLANWATGFKSKRSSRRGAGPRAQGLGSQRVNPTGAFRGGM
ncbi:head-to-tail connector [Synechococcus phage DSL-LC07]|nr:head-to-tail connector [Synechococcus phage DSL-LC07]